MLSDKFIRKYMRMARFVATDQPVCYSRHIGAVIVNPVENRVVSTGYNGPPRNTPHTDDYNYLRDFVWPQLTKEEKSNSFVVSGDSFAATYQGCKTCPRRLIGAKSGERTELCTCDHAERNAIYNSNESLAGCYMFLWSDVSCCVYCSNAIIQKKIQRLYMLDVKDYQPGVQFLQSSAGLEVVRLEESRINTDIGPLFPA